MVTEWRLSDLLSEFARTLVTDFPIQAILDHLVVRIVEVLPIGSAGVTLISDGNDARHVAASDESALRFVKLQTELGEGPCITAYQTGQKVAVADLRDDGRFPKFSERAVEEGLIAVFSFPLRHEDRQLGALDLYRQSPGPLDVDDLDSAQTLADVTSAYLINAESRTALRASSESARHSSLHDPLTGLPNRTLFVQRLDHAMLRCRRSKRMVAVLFADLDRFKSINDTYGHLVGDELLQAIAERLTAVLRPGDTLARLAGDEFVVLCEDLDDASQVEPVAVRIGEALSEAFDLSVGAVQVSASVGIAFAGLGDDIPETVLKEADAAMYQAKGRGGARHAIIDLREHRLTNHRARLNRDLHGALARGELCTQYQPIVATADGQITEVEALLRWAHPAHGIVGPDTVVPLAEQSGLIIDIGSWLLEMACLDRRRWERHSHHGEIGISVNISTHQIMAADFAASVSAVLSQTSTDPRLVTLEVTESVFARDAKRALVVFHDLKKIGVRLALDDFGTGFSSLSYLKQFPVDVVKLDREFIAELERDHASRLIVSAVVGLAHGLDMVVVAEGIESHTQHEAATAFDCDFGQGYHFSPPLSPNDLDSLLAETRTLPLTEPELLRATPRSRGEQGGHGEHAMSAMGLPSDSSELSRWRRGHA